MCQLATEIMEIFRHRPMICCKLHHDIGISRPNWPRSAVRQIQAAIWQPHNVNDAGQLGRRNLAPNSILDLIADRRRFFDPRSRGCPQVQLEFSAIYLGEKVLSHEGKQRKRQCESRKKTSAKRLLMPDRACQHALIAVPKTLKPDFEFLLDSHKNVSRFVCAATCMMSRPVQ